MRLGIFAFQKLPEDQKQSLAFQFVELYNLFMSQMSISPTRKKIGETLNITEDVIRYLLYQIRKPDKRNQKYKGFLNRKTFELLDSSEQFNLKMKVRKEIINKMALKNKSITESEKETSQELKMTLALVQELSLTQNKIKTYVEGVLNGTNIH